MLSLKTYIYFYGEKNPAAFINKSAKIKKMTKCPASVTCKSTSLPKLNYPCQRSIKKLLDNKY